MFKPQTRSRLTLALNCAITTSLAAAFATSTQAQVHEFKIDSFSRSSGPSMQMHTSGSSVRMMSPGSFRNLMRPDYSRRDLKLMFSGLDIDQSQRYVLEILMDEYTNQFKTLVDEFKDVRDRYEWPHRGLFNQQMASGFAEDILHNLENAQVIELSGDGGQFVGMTTSTVDLSGESHTGVFIAGESGAAQSQSGTMHSIVMIAAPEGESDEGEDMPHTIPPEVLEKLKECQNNSLIFF